MEKQLAWRDLHSLNYRGLHKYLEILEGLKNGEHRLYALGNDEGKNISENQIGVFVLFIKGEGEVTYDFFDMANFQCLRERLEILGSDETAMVTTFEGVQFFFDMGCAAENPEYTNGYAVHEYRYKGLREYGYLDTQYRGRAGYMPGESRYED